MTGINGEFNAVEAKLKAAVADRLDELAQPQPRLSMLDDVGVEAPTTRRRARSITGGAPAASLRTRAS